MKVWFAVFLLPVTIRVVQAFPACSVCGEGSAVSIPDFVLDFIGRPFVTCQVLDEAGANGELPPSQCDLIAPLIQDACGCIQTPSAAPVPTMSISPTMVVQTLPPNTGRQRPFGASNCTTSECIHNADERIPERNVEFEGGQSSSTIVQTSSAPSSPGFQSSNPTLVVSSSLCAPSSDGSYGSTEGKNVVVSFFYEVELSAGVADVEQIIAGVLEPAFGQVILSTLLPGSCSGRQRNLQHQVRRKLQITGISMEPADEIVGGGKRGWCEDTA